MAEHLEESTNVVKSNKKLTGAILLKYYTDDTVDCAEHAVAGRNLLSGNCILCGNHEFIGICFIRLSNGFRRQIIMGWNQIAAVASGAIALVGANLHRMADLSDDGIRCKSKRLKAPEILGILGG